MLLPGLKRKSILTRVRRAVQSTVTTVVPKSPKRVGVIVDVARAGEIKTIRASLKQWIGPEPEYLYYVPYVKKSDLKDAVIIDDTTIGWRGVIKNSEAKTWAAQPYDLLITLTDRSPVAIQLLEAVSQAKFKVALDGSDSQVAQLTLKVSAKDISTIVTEIQKYLGILAKTA